MKLPILVHCSAYWRRPPVSPWCQSMALSVVLKFSNLQSNPWTVLFLPVVLCEIYCYYQYYCYAISSLVGCSHIDKRWKSGIKYSYDREREREREQACTCLIWYNYTCEEQLLRARALLIGLWQLVLAAEKADFSCLSLGTWVQMGIDLLEVSSGYVKH